MVLFCVDKQSVTGGMHTSFHGRTKYFGQLLKCYPGINFAAHRSQVALFLISGLLLLGEALLTNKNVNLFCRQHNFVFQIECKTNGPKPSAIRASTVKDTYSGNFSSCSSPCAASWAKFAHCKGSHWAEKRECQFCVPIQCCEAGSDAALHFCCWLNFTDDPPKWDACYLLAKSRGGQVVAVPMPTNERLHND